VCLAGRLAKAKRERLRRAHLAPDYLPLGGASRLIGAGGAAGGSSGAWQRCGWQRPPAQEGWPGGGWDWEEDEQAAGFGSASDNDKSDSDMEGDLEERMRMTFVGQQPGGGGAAAAAAGWVTAGQGQQQQEPKAQWASGSSDSRRAVLHHCTARGG